MFGSRRSKAASVGGLFHLIDATIRSQTQVFSSSGWLPQRTDSALLAIADARAESIFVVTQGKYSVWFKTPIGEGAGVVEFGPHGRLTGGDTTFSYSGNWSQVGERFKAALSARRIAPGPPGVFGRDEIDIVVSGDSDGGASVSCNGFAKQSPGLRLDVVLMRIGDD
jgi:hypothetical protein